MSQTAIGVIGHSDGAMTVAGMTMSTSYSDPRIKAVAVMSGRRPARPDLEQPQGRADPGRAAEPATRTTRLRTASGSSTT